MKAALSTLTDRLLILHREESGQDLIEYSLLVALIALAAVAGMSTLANNISNAFSTIGSRLSSAAT
jgi:pilus assembly protein Flp/PilA